MGRESSTMITFVADRVKINGPRVDGRRKDKKDWISIKSLLVVYPDNGRTNTAVILNKSERWVKRWASHFKLKVKEEVVYNNLSQGIKKSFIDRNHIGKNNPAFGIKRDDLKNLNISRIGIELKNDTKYKIAESVRKALGNYTGVNKAAVPRPNKLFKDKIKKARGICELCGSLENLELDHIKPISLYPELAKEIKNLRVLCKECHIMTDTYAGKIRKYKQEYFIYS